MRTETFNDALSRIRVAQIGRKLSVSVPYSNFNLEILLKLVDMGYLQSIEKVQKLRKKATIDELKVHLKYVQNGPVIRGIKSYYKPTMHRSYSCSQVHKMRNKGGYIFSTKVGLLSDLEVLYHQIGGILLLRVW
jgi:small subunit ribosomal protein S8